MNRTIFILVLLLTLSSQFEWHVSFKNPKCQDECKRPAEYMFNWRTKYNAPIIAKYQKCVLDCEWAVFETRVKEICRKEILESQK